MPTISIPSQEEQLTLLFDSMLPAGQRMFSAKEIAGLLNVHVKSIGNAFDKKKLLGFGLNLGGAGDYDRKRFPREFVLLHLARAANFTVDKLRANIDDMTRNLATPVLDYLIESATAERAQRGEE